MDLSLTESDWQEFNKLTSSMVVEGERFGKEAEPWAGNEAVTRKSYPLNKVQGKS